MVDSEATTEERGLLMLNLSLTEDMDTEVMEDTMVDSEATTEERGLLMLMPML